MVYLQHNLHYNYACSEVAMFIWVHSSHYLYWFICTWLVKTKPSWRHVMMIEHSSKHLCTLAQWWTAPPHHLHHFPNNSGVFVLIINSGKVKSIKPHLLDHNVCNYSIIELCIINTIANREACSDEWPNVSICHAILGRYWEPKVLVINLNPTIGKDKEFYIQWSIWMHMLEQGSYTLCVANG